MELIDRCIRLLSWIHGMASNIYNFDILTTDNRVRSDGHQVFTGFLSVTIMEMSLVSYHRRNMLMCAEWYSSLKSVPRNPR